MDYKGTVLLVEDNVELNANNARALRTLNYEVHPALTLAEARAWLAGNEPDVILLDVMLPDGDGIDFCAEIRGAPLRTAAHILFLTGRTEHEDRVRGLAEGGDDYITKPFHSRELFARVEAAMRRRSMSRPDNRMPQNGTQSLENAGVEKLCAFAAYHGFTTREAEVLALLCQGASRIDMEQKLGIRESTLRPYVSRMLKKSGVKTRTELVARASNFQADGLRPGTSMSVSGQSGSTSD